MIIFAYKTYILLYLFKKQYNMVSYYLEKLIKFRSQKNINEFIELINNWVNNREIKKGRLFTLDMDLNRELDPWEKTLMNYVNTEKQKDRSSHIVNNDFIIFVEGIIDIAILEEFKNKLNIPYNLKFIKSEGFTNLSIPPQEQELIKEQKIPIIYIYDGDTLNNSKKRKARTNIEDKFKNIPINKFTLNKNNIENYIIISKAIKKAFPKIKYSVIQIEEYIKINYNKRNKKSVLEEILRINNIKYDADSARKIAQNMELYEVDPELKELFIKIINIRK
jgi:hypothetical protein